MGKRDRPWASYLYDDEALLGDTLGHVHLVLQARAAHVDACGINHQKREKDVVSLAFIIVGSRSSVRVSGTASITTIVEIKHTGRKQRPSSGPGRQSTPITS